MPREVSATDEVVDATRVHPQRRPAYARHAHERQHGDARGAIRMSVSSYAVRQPTAPALAGGDRWRRERSMPLLPPAGGEGERRGAGGKRQWQCAYARLCSVYVSAPEVTVWNGAWRCYRQQCIVPPWSMKRLPSLDIYEVEFAEKCRLPDAARNGVT